MTLIEIGRPQISGGCPYKILNSQWVPTRPEAMNVTTLHCDGSLIWLSFGFSLRTVFTWRFGFLRRWLLKHGRSDR